MKKLLTFLIICYFLLPLHGQEVEKQRDTLIVAYTTAPPFIVDQEGTPNGINIWLWNEVAQDLELEYKLVPMGFAEMLSALKTGTIDVCINPLTITGARSRDIAFTHAFYASNATIAVAETSSFQKIFPVIAGFANRNFLRGFIALLVLILIFGLAGWVFERKKNPEQFRPGPRGIWDGFWWSLVTLTTVGYGDKAPKSSSGKITAFILMVIGLLFISGLTASIASSLTVNQLSSNPEGFNEFKERKVGTVKNTSSKAFLDSRFFKNVSTYSNVSNGLADLNQHKIEAFIYDEPILRFRIKQDSSLQNLSVLPIKFNVQFYAFGLSKENKDLRDVLSHEILEIIEGQEWQMILNEFGLSEF
jgi:ABC-type amino acid transport substrate-binding protein